jgi:hypothetical protein
MVHNAGPSATNERRELAEMRFLKAVSGYKLVDKKCNKKDIGDELHVPLMLSIISKYQEELYVPLGKVKETRIPKIMLNYRPRGRRSS